MAKKSKRFAARIISPATKARLDAALRILGKDALQPAPSVLAEPWAMSIHTATRDELKVALKAMNGNGTAGCGFDDGPIGKTMLVWITTNRVARYPNPAAVWEQAIRGNVPASVPNAVPSKPKRVGPTARVNNPTPSVQPPVAPAAVPDAGVAPEVKVPEPVIAAATAISKADNFVSPAEKMHPEWNWQPASKVFGVKSLKGKVAVWPKQGDEKAHPRVPEADPSYIWQADHLQWAVFAAGEYPAKGEWFWGNRGAGKTEFATQFAAQTGRPFYKCTFSRTMEPSEFIGDMGAKSGEKGGTDSVWNDGEVLQGLRNPLPSVFLLDEISYGQSSHVSGPLNEIVHPLCSFTVPRTGERIRFCKAHLFFAADNTNGTGDPSGMYIGSNQINKATMDRFSFFRRFTYLPKQLEIRLLKQRAMCDEATAERVWGILDALRKKVDAGLLSDPPSIREAIAFCCALRYGFDEKDAFETCFVGKYPEESQEEMRVTFVAAFNATPDVQS